MNSTSALPRTATAEGLDVLDASMDAPVNGHDPAAEARAEWTEHDSIVAGLTWRVAQAGTGPVTLLLHGTGGSIHSWQALLPCLAPHVHLVAVDLPGHGRTGYPGFERLSLVDMAQQLRDFLRAEGLAPAIVVGHSAGAAIMLQLAADGAFPQETLLVGINAALHAPHPAVQELMRGSLGALFRSRPARAFVRGVGTSATLIEMLLSTTGSRLSKEQEAAYVQTFADPEHVEAAYAMMASWDLAPLVAALPRIAHATLYITGDRDTWVPPAAARDACARMPHARVASITGAGHLVHEERPQEVAALILDAYRPPPSGAHSAS
ncbi:MAG: alpha/beta fold hydrolase BchO [Gemmatimonadaceae bacterium]